MQLTNSKKIVGGLALAGTLMLTGIVGFAQQETTQTPGAQKHERQGRGGKGMRGMRGGFLGRFAQNLNLTDAQKEQMQQIAARHRESTKALRQQTHETRGDFGALNGGAFDEAAIRAAAQARANAHVEMEVAQARMMSEMYAVLTPEQKAQIATQRQQWEQKRHERRAARGGSVQNQ
ncbi:MAG TPA: Spy/CpxP family protein refolding chaperone [Pyrinomonadaceae bacterium]|nr:Spy/CpxP family protein refolding chaperone [Pyrinomonadaceae bacterium]